MNDKTKLIQSMTNLIYHVSTSRKNQQQIFSTLSQTDLKKILNNLEDSNQKLRKITLILLAQLLYENIGLQKKFCQITSITANAGKIVFSSNFAKEIIADSQSVVEVFRALKDQINFKQRALFWYIDSQSKPKVLKIGQRNTTVDPLNCIVGVWVLEQTNYYINVNYQQSIHNSNRVSLKSNQQIDKTNLLSPTRVDFKNINPLNGKVRLNRSQQLQKNNQIILQPEKPLKFVTNAERQKYSLTAVVPRTKQYNYNQINYTLIHPTTQIKPFIQPEIKKIINYPQRQNSQTINMQIDNMKYVRTNNYNNRIITPINSMSTVNSLNSTTNVRFGVNLIQPFNTYDGGMQNKIHVFYSQNMREPCIQFRKHQ